MKKNLYAVHDLKANVYGLPFVAVNTQIATRSFARACNDPSCDVGMYPNDFNLQQLGSFDDESGEIEPIKPIVVAFGAQCVVPSNQLQLSLDKE